MLEPGKYSWALTLNPLAYFKNKFILNFRKDQSELVLKTIPGKLNMNWLWERQASLGLHHTSGKVFYWHTHLCLLLFPCSFPHIPFSKPDLCASLPERRFVLENKKQKLLTDNLLSGLWFSGGKYMEGRQKRRVLLAYSEEKERE